MDTPASKYSCNVGDLVYIKSEGDKQNIRNFNLVVDIEKEFTTIQKQLVKCDEIFPAVETKFREENQLSSDEGTDLEEESEQKICSLWRTTTNRKPTSWLNSNEYDLP